MSVCLPDGHLLYVPSGSVLYRYLKVKREEAINQAQYARNSFSKFNLSSLPSQKSKKYYFFCDYASSVV